MGIQMYLDNINIKKRRNMNRKKNGLYLIPVLTALMIMVIGMSFTFKQVKIPLDNEKGVPFYKDKIDYYVDGFDVDEKGNFYFSGGNNSIIVCFTEDKLNYTKKFTEFKSNQIYIHNNYLYLFDNKYNKRNLFVLNKNNGTIIKKITKITKDVINSYIFNDSSLIIETFTETNSININENLKYYLYSLEGSYVKQVYNKYALPVILNPKNISEEFLGCWNENYVYCEYDLDKKLYKFILKNKLGKILANQNIEEKYFGKRFCENPQEHRKLKNGIIYFIGRDKTVVVVTLLPLNILFNK